MEQWVTQVLGSLDAPDLKVITMMDYVDVVQEEIVEGMEGSHVGHYPRVFCGCLAECPPISAG